MTCMGELIWRQWFRIKEHSFFAGRQQFLNLTLKEKIILEGVWTWLWVSLPLHFVNAILQLNLWHQVCSLLSTTFPCALLTPLYTTNPEILHLLMQIGTLHFMMLLTALPQQDPKTHTPNCWASFSSRHTAFRNYFCWVHSDDGGCYEAVGGLFLGCLFLHVTHLLPLLSPQVAGNYSLRYGSADTGWLF